MYRIVFFMSRVEQNLLPNMFKMQFTYLRDVHNHNTRASKRNQINIPNTNTHFFDLNDFLAKHVKTPEDLCYKGIRGLLAKHFLSNY